MTIALIIACLALAVIILRQRAEIARMEFEHEQLSNDLEDVAKAYAKLTDRDERGRFKK